MPTDAQHQSDWDLLERCRKGEQQAWRELVDGHQRGLRLSIRSQGADEAKDIQTVEDIEQEVWLALIDKDYKRLGLYDPGRGCFDTFLKSVARQVIQLRRRRKYHRHKRESALGDHEPPDPTPNEGLVRAEFAEFQADLTKQEGRCLREGLLGIASQDATSRFSRANSRYLKHRIEKKWNQHFDTP
jgi:DNA-directed RNA polymerase specialized sigma24 family protein